MKICTFISREYIRTPDGGQVSLDWYDPKGNGRDCRMDSLCDSSLHTKDSIKPIAIFFPGLAGCSQADYLRTLIPQAHQLGYRVVAANYRGNGNMKLLTPRFYCGTTDDDLDTMLEHIR